MDTAQSRFVVYMMRRVHLGSVLGFLVASLSTTQGLAQNACIDPWPLDRAFVMYTYSPLPTSLLDKIADRFEFSIEGYRPDVQYMINRNSKYKYAAIYNSVSDNLVSGSGPLMAEHQWIFANASTYGLDGEDAYLHFWEDSVVEVAGQQFNIPGWNPNPMAGDPPATATSRDQARIPTYFSDLSRTVTNFSTPVLRTMHRDYVVHSLNQPLFDNTYPGGVFLDNASHYRSTLTVINGGRIAEHPQHLVMNSPEAVEWYYTQGLKLFMTELTMHIRNNPSAVGNRPTKVIANVSNLPHIANPSWEESYLSPPVVDILFLEFEYNPIRNTGMDLPQVIYDKHTMAINSGVSIFETGARTTDRPGILGSFLATDVIMNNLAAHWVHRANDAGSSARTYVLGNGIWDIVSERADWELNVAAAFDADLGAAQGPPFVLQSGTDGKGNAYKVYARELACGLAIVRHREPWNGDFDETTAVTVDLTKPLIPLTLYGNHLSETSTWSLRNGQGQIFLSPESTAIDDLPPAAPTNLRRVPEKKPQH